MLPPDLKPGEYIVEISYQYGEELFATLRVPIKVELPQPKEKIIPKPPEKGKPKSATPPTKK